MNRANNNKLKSKTEEFCDMVPSFSDEFQTGCKSISPTYWHGQNGLSPGIFYLICCQLTQTSNDRFGHWGEKASINDEALKQPPRLSSPFPLHSPPSAFSPPAAAGPGPLPSPGPAPPAAAPAGGPARSPAPGPGCPRTSRPAGSRPLGGSRVRMETSFHLPPAAGWWAWVALVGLLSSRGLRWAPWSCFTREKRSLQVLLMEGRGGDVVIQTHDDPSEQARRKSESSPNGTVGGWGGQTPGVFKPTEAPRGKVVPARS